ncbi:MAG: hypothetical protein BZY88_14460 [SAR202 cluster bacterium Io17-Chloro-G9]|nr:MAG: hypothetical protein BZY88_14460 [SAR202 cluster bacterium Io17-Chloro-G9]
MPSVFFYVIMAGLLGWWTTRLARTKGKPMPWMWGLPAFLMTLLPLPEPLRLLGMVPLFILIFMRSPQPRVDSPPKELICPKCQASHSASQRYCISCGWELGRTYPETGAGAETTAETPQVGSPEIDRPEPVLASESSNDVVAEAAPEPAAPTRVEPEPAPEVPAYSGIPTAPGMTERGVQLFNQGRTQEAIDQFTKAIALDANYKNAWERRAEAYSVLGRDGEAAEDRRRLNAINPSSSTG